MSKIGVDIIEIKRMKLDQKLLSKFLSKDELDRLNSFENKKRKKEFAAGRWAAKEAIIKSTSKHVIPNKIDIKNNDNGAPYIANKGYEKFSISISHENKYSVAVAINEGE